MCSLQILKSFILGPTPDAAYEVQLHYYFDPPSIVTSSTSWLGENATEALLYGSLVEAYIFMKGEQDVLGMYSKVQRSYGKAYDPWGRKIEAR